MNLFLHMKVHMKVQKRLQVRVHEGWAPSSRAGTDASHRSPTGREFGSPTSPIGDSPSPESSVLKSIWDVPTLPWPSSILCRGWGSVRSPYVSFPTLWGPWWTDHIFQYCPALLCNTGKYRPSWRQNLVVLLAGIWLKNIFFVIFQKVLKSGMHFSHYGVFIFGGGRGAIFTKNTKKHWKTL